MPVTSSAIARRTLAVCAFALIAVPLSGWLAGTVTAQQPAAIGAPVFQVDPAWPAIPNNWVLGEVTSIAVDANDHIWVLHVPQSIPEAQRANAAPPVLEFDQAGKLLASWGGPGEGKVWPGREHGIFVDDEGFRLDRRARRMAAADHAGRQR